MTPRTDDDGGIITREDFREVAIMLATAALGITLFTVMTPVVGLAWVMRRFWPSHQEEQQ